MEGLEGRQRNPNEYGGTFRRIGSLIASLFEEIAVFILHQLINNFTYIEIFCFDFSNNVRINDLNVSDDDMSLLNILQFHSNTPQNYTIVK